MALLEPIKHMQWSLFEKIVNAFKSLKIFAKKLYRRCFMVLVTSLHFELILTEWEFLILTGLFIFNERQPSTKGFYKNEIPKS